MTTDDVKAADRADRARANGYRTRMRAERDRQVRMARRHHANGLTRGPVKSSKS